jgi:hypothetical protein
VKSSSRTLQHDSAVSPHSKLCHHKIHRQAFDGRVIDQFQDLCQSPLHPLHRYSCLSTAVDYLHDEVLVNVTFYREI